MGATGLTLLDTAMSVAIFAQRNRAPVRNADADAAAGGIMAFLAIYLVVVLLISLPMIIGMWKAFEKAGQPGWAAIIPIYNLYVMNQVAQKEPIWFILALVGFLCAPLSLVALVVINLGIAEKFGKGAGYGIGLTFLGFIFWPMLGFGDARYQRKRRRQDYYEDEDEDEEEERPRKKKSRDYDDDDDDDRPRRR